MENTNADGRIPLRSIADLDSLDAAVVLNVNGLINNQRSQGALNGLVTMNGPKSKVTVSGSLLGEVAAQVGGSLVGLFTPSTVDLYKVPDGAYVVVNGFFPLCVKPHAPQAVAVLEDMNPQNLLAMLTSSDAAIGRLAGQTVLNGRSVNHYIIDGATFLAAAQSSSDPKLRAFGEGLWSAEDADLYVDAQDGYPVAFRGGYSGAYDPLKFSGVFNVQIELTAVNANTPVELPASCDDPIAM